MSYGTESYEITRRDSATALAYGALYRELQRNQRRIRIGRRQVDGTLAASAAATWIYVVAVAIQAL